MKKAGAKTIRWRFIAVIYMISLLYLLFQGGKTALMLFIILNLLLLYLLLGRWSGIGKVTGSRIYVSHGSAVQVQSISAGNRLDVSLEIKVPGFYPLPYVIVRDELQRHNGQRLAFESSFVPSWKRGGKVDYQTPPLRRGEYRFRHTECLAYDIFGLFEHSGRFASEAVFSVLPQTVPLKQWNGIQRGVRGPYSHAVASRSAKETTQINGVREYLYGDRLSRIHWNATAKTGQWKSKAFERESLPRTLIILDRYPNKHDGMSSERFELAVSVAASLLENGLRQDTAMGLLTIGAQMMMLPPKSGAEQHDAVMKHLTFVEADASHPLHLSLQNADSAMDPGCFAILITSHTGPDVIRSMEWLSRKGMTPSLLYIGASSSSAKDSYAWRQMLQGRGWQFFEVKQLQELPAAMEGGAGA